MSPPKAGREGKKWPAVVVFVFLGTEKFARVRDMLNVAFLAPRSTVHLELDVMRVSGAGDGPPRMQFQDWRTAKRPIVGSGAIEIAVNNAEATERRSLFGVLVVLAILQGLSLLLR